jgi:hypothetical protein
MAVALDIISATSNSSNIELEQATTKFINTTKQVETYIEISQDFSEEVMETFVKIGGNVLKFENAVINQRKGSILETQEKRGLNKVVLRKLAEAMKSTGSSIGTRIYRALTIGRSSPSIIDYAASVVANTIQGTNTPRFKKTTPKSKSTKIATKVPIIVGLAKNRVKLKGKQVATTAARPIFDLEAILRARINEQVRQNMGSGNETRILNYRTGRFSESVSIERISESRQGMISVFYNYMKNPYATFSDGGRQQYPKTRDPKALISKSIREIAGPMVANRLRSVVV